MSELPHHPHQGPDFRNPLEEVELFRRDEPTDLVPPLHEIAVEGAQSIPELTEVEINPIDLKTTMARTARIKANRLGLEMDALVNDGKSVPWQLRERYEQYLDAATVYQNEAYALAHPPRRLGRRIMQFLFGNKEQS